MDADPLQSSLLASEDLTDDKLMVKGVPQLSIPCATIRISHKHVLKKAAKKLGVSIHGYKFTSLGVGDEDILGSVHMDIPPHRGHPLTMNQEFYGEWSMFSTSAKESACLTALKYLKNEGLIVVHDTNYAELKVYKRKFEEQQFWATEFYDRAIVLQAKLPAKTTDSTPVATPSVGHPSMGSSAGIYSFTTPSTGASTSTREKKDKPCPRLNIKKELFPTK